MLIFGRSSCRSVKMELLPLRPKRWHEEREPESKDATTVAAPPCTRAHASCSASPSPATCRVEPIATHNTGVGRREAERQEAKVKRSGRRRASGGGAAEAEVERPEAKMERSGQRRARGGGGGTVGTTSGVERGRDCDVLWRRRGVRQRRSVRRRSGARRRCNAGRRRSERGRGAMWGAADGWHEAEENGSSIEGHYIYFYCA
jgi:hypothetical protein